MATFMYGFLKTIYKVSYHNVILSELNDSKPSLKKEGLLLSKESSILIKIPLLLKNYLKAFTKL